MHESILVTGVAGSGKSSICGELKKLGYKAYDIEDETNLFTMVDKITGNRGAHHDNDNLASVKEHDWVCNKSKLQELISSNPEGITFYCGTASNIDELVPLFNKTLLLKVNSEMLRKRLTTRKAKDFGNTADVRDWVLSWKDWWEDKLAERGATVIDAGGTAIEVAQKIIDIVNSGVG